jgi:hypothetical protein
MIHQMGRTRLVFLFFCYVLPVELHDLALEGETVLLQQSRPVGLKYDHLTVIKYDHPTVINYDHPTVINYDHPTVYQI